MGEFENSFTPAVEPAEPVQVVEVAQQRSVLVDHALGRARGAGRVDDHHPVARRHVAFDRVEEVVVDARAGCEERRERVVGVDPAAPRGVGLEVHVAQRRHRGRTAGRRRRQVEPAPLLQRGDVVVPR